MANSPDSDVSTALIGALEKARFDAGDPLTASDLNAEHRYRTGLLRHHLRYLHGWGVLCGLMVVPLPEPDHPWQIRVCPGYGISPCGAELLLAGSVDADLRDLAWMRALDPYVHRIFVGLRFVGIPASPVELESCGCRGACGCGPKFKPSRTRDGVEVVVSLTPPLRRPTVDLCSGEPVPCPRCSPTCDLVLAEVTLPDSESSAITAYAINNSIRLLI